LKLPVIRSGKIQCYGFKNFKSVLVKRFRRRYIPLIATAELQTANVAYFQRKIQVLVFSAYPDGSPSPLIQIIKDLLYLNYFKKEKLVGK